MPAEAVPIEFCVLFPAAILMKPKASSKPERNRYSSTKNFHPARRTKPAQEEEDASRPAVGTLARTKLLLLAALRVWELKNGFRPEPQLQPAHRGSRAS
jgi:hypothetical protein